MKSTILLLAFVLTACGPALPVASTPEPLPADLPQNVATSARLANAGAPLTDPSGPAPEIVYTLSGQELRLSALRGQKVVLNFWATWCVPCRAEMPELQRLADSGAVTVLAVNKAESLAQIGPFLKEVPLRFPILPDRDATIGERYLVKVLPTTIFINTDGTVSARHIGPLTPDVITQQLAALH